MSWQQILIAAFVVVSVWALVLIVLQRHDRKSLGDYRSTHDDRYPNRDEFTAFMRDCK